VVASGFCLAERIAGGDRCRCRPAGRPALAGSVRSYLDRIRAKWAATDEPVEDIRTLLHEYPRDVDPNGPA